VLRSSFCLLFSQLRRINKYVYWKHRCVLVREATIRCNYPENYENSIKFFCKEDSQQNYKNKGRFSILNTISGFFTVTITRLEKSDSGKYWCGVNRLLKDTYTEVHLKVTDGKFTLNRYWYLVIINCGEAS
uniref:Immunoglobulin domain-containing protein n=1 Tax=Hucho hucho TaxID=62062 RepID=A0A4W5LIT9_9TELE